MKRECVVKKKVFSCFNWWNNDGNTTDLLKKLCATYIFIYFWQPTFYLLVISFAVSTLILDKDEETATLTEYNADSL